MMSNKFEHKKSLGQHFLNSAVVPKWMCDAAALTEGDTVLEIGPGTGMLTRELLGRGVRVVGLEADERALAVLHETFSEEIASGTLTLHHTDVRNLQLTDFGLHARRYKVVSNIPYYLTGQLLRNVLESAEHPATLVYLVQKEVAKRICTSSARGEKESLLSLSVKAYGTPTYIRTVSRGHFVPPPQVDSAIIAVTDISKERFDEVKESFFFSMLHLGFGQKRKQLLGNLSSNFDREAVVHSFSTLDLPPTIRAEDLDIDTWLKLCELLAVQS